MNRAILFRYGLPAALVIIAIAAGIYGIGKGSGNVATACTSSPEIAKQMAGLNTGAVAAFSFTERLEDISAVSFDDLQGKRRTLSEWKDRVVLLNLWATWCAPCREEMPALKALQEGLGGKDFEVVPVSIDIGTAQKPKNFYVENDLSALPFFHDGKMAPFNDLKKRSLAFGMPTTLLVGRDGCVIGALNGPADWASDEAKALVGKAIGAKAL